MNRFHTITPWGNASRPRRRAAALALPVLLALLAACSRGEQAGSPAQPRRAAAAPPAHLPQPAPDLGEEHTAGLMEALYGSQYSRERRQALVRSQEDGAEVWRLHNLASAYELPDGQIAVIVNASLSNAAGADLSSEHVGGLLNVYRLAYAADSWTVLERHEGLARLGSHGYMGSVRWILLAPAKPGFLVSSYSVDGGRARSVANIFALDGAGAGAGGAGGAGGVRRLGSLDEMSSDANGCQPGSATCTDLEGRLRFVDAPAGTPYRDIVVDYTGKRYSLVENERQDWVERVQAEIRQTARYRFDGKTYVRVAGSSPFAED